MADSGEVERFFAQATAWYQAQGLASTKPEIVRLDELGERLAAVDVRWRAYDASGEEKSSDRSY